MEKLIKNRKTSNYVGVERYEAESIEATIRRALANKEPINGNFEPVYMERNEGVRTDTDIRADKFEILVEKTARATEIFRERRTKGLEIKKKEQELNEQLKKTLKEQKDNGATTL